MATIKGFFFDLDDTLVGTKDANYAAYRDAFNDAGLALTYETFSAHWGKDSRQSIPQIAPQLSFDEVNYIRHQKSKHYEKYLHTTRPNEVLINFLDSVAQHYITVLVTTAKRKNGQEILRIHGLEKRFTHVIFGDEVAAGKPDPEAYLKALSVTKLLPEEVVVFEDSENGIAAAKAAQLAVIQVRHFV